VEAVLRAREEVPVPAAFRCNECGRPWRDGDAKWPVRVTDGDPARIVVACLDCADLKVGHEARWCPLTRWGPPALGTSAG